MVCVLVYLVIREMRRPELDVVRRSYEYDPDGGVLNDAPDYDDFEPPILDDEGAESAPQSSKIAVTGGR
jgi:hypothetical protein